MLDRFTQEVLLRGAEACLPKNLSTEWVDALANKLSEYFQKDPENNPTYGNEDGPFCCALAATFLIVSAKSQQYEIETTVDELHESLMHYWVELGLENLHRSPVALRYNPANMETIFTDRQLTMSLKIWEKIVTP